MDATYTNSELVAFTAALRLGTKEQLTVGQRMDLGSFDSKVIAKEVLDFLAKDYPTIEAVEAAAATTSKQFRKLVEFGILTLTASY